MRTSIVTMIAILIVCADWFAPTGRACAQTMTMYVIPSPRQIDWNSPRSLALSAAGNSKTLEHAKAKRPIGHAFIELRDDRAGYLRLTGSSTCEDTKVEAEALQESMGLGVLFQKLPGRLERTEDLRAELPARFRSGKIAFMTFELSEQNFARVRQYLEEYEERGYHRIYNGANRPREGLGAGCSAFAVSFLEVAGVLDRSWEDAWSIWVRVPRFLIGGSFEGHGEPRRVSLGDVLRTGRWAEPFEPHWMLHFYEPWLMYGWIQNTHAVHVAHPRSDIRAETIGEARGLVFDRTGQAPPREPIFLDPQGDGYVGSAGMSIVNFAGTGGELEPSFSGLY